MFISTGAMAGLGVGTLALGVLLGVLGIVGYEKRGAA